MQLKCFKCDNRNFDVMRKIEMSFFSPNPLTSINLKKGEKTLNFKNNCFYPEMP